MTNADIATVFRTIAEILQLQEENPFRIRAYERAAMAIESMSRSLADVYRDGGLDALQELPGIGKDLALKIEELTKTGKLGYIEILQQKVPGGLLEMMTIPGMGPKKTTFVWKKFGVTDIAALEKLAKSGKLEDLKGWGTKSVENILKGIEVRRTAGARAPIYVALPLAEEIVGALRSTKLCDKIEIAGSLRRRRETIGDIDILATSKKPDELMDFFCALPMVKDLIGRGPTKASVRLKNGLNVDLRVLEPHLFGAALHYFTGSKAHNVHLRTIAVRRGITISEYGVFKGTAEKKGALLASETEEQVFAAMGLPWIPPEIREDRGEIEAAMQKELPELLELKHIRGDLHVHSTFSDGSADMIDMAKAARGAGLEYIAFTDHGSGMGMVKGIKPGNIKEYLRLIEKARKAVPDIHILAGAEVDIQEDGSLYLPDDVLSQLDWVIAAVHTKFQMSFADMTERVLRAVRHPLVDALAHPAARLLAKRPKLDYDYEKVFQEAVAYDVAIELNASPYRLDVDDVHCKLAVDLGAMIEIGSDAHHPKEFEYRYGVSQGRRGWLEKNRVLNALTWQALKKRLDKRTRKK